MPLPRFVLILLFPLPLAGQSFHTYVGRIETDAVLLAWGTTEGRGNTIGRHSSPHGKAIIRLANRQVQSEQNWVRIAGLQPDTEYPYEILLDSKRIGAGSVRTYPLEADKLAFFVIGDYGTGQSAQYEIAEALGREFERRSRSENPVRFVLTTGDNIYADRLLGFFRVRSGNRDEHWGSKFFQPFERLLRHIPFYPTLGNHDSGGSEPPDDLEAYLDNFFFPAPEPARFYSFSFGQLADFFALDSTAGESLADGPANKSRQLQWLQGSLTRSEAPWKIAYFHHPPFSAGPRHGPSLPSLRHLVDLFQTTGVQVVFNGHEHNFQYSERNGETGNVLYVISSGGSNVRTRDIRAHMEESNIAGWANLPHFLLVEIEDRIMRITPLGPQRVIVRDKNGNPQPLPILLRAPD